MIGYLEENLTKGKTVCLASTSKAKLIGTVDRLQNVLEKQGMGKRVLVITSDTDPELKAEALEDIQAYCIEHRIALLAYTPTITAGNDIPKKIFDIVVMYVSEGSVVWQDMWQMVHRVREPEIVIFLLNA